MAGMSDASTPVSGMPILPPPAQVASPPATPLLSGRSYMRGPGVDDSGPAIQLPATAPIGPTALGNAIGAAVARPGGMPVPSVASGGTNGPTMTPQELVAAKQASVAPFFQGMIGPGAVQARQDMTSAWANGNVAGAAGDAIRGVGLSAAHMVSQPVVSAAETVGDGIGAAAGAVSRFARGLFGGADAPAVQASAQAPIPAQVAAPAVPMLPTALGPMAGLSAGPRPGVAQYIGPNGTTRYVASTAFDSQPVAQAQPAAQAQPQTAGMPLPAAAIASVTPGAPVQTAFEKSYDLPAGSINQLIAQARPSQRPAVISQLLGMQQTAHTEAAKELVRNTAMQNYNEAIQPKAGQSADDLIAAKRAARMQLAKDLLATTNPAGATAANLTGAFSE